MRVCISFTLLFLMLISNFTKCEANSRKKVNYYPEEYVNGSTCNRPCDGKPKKCYFDFAVETFYTMSKACYSCPRVLSDCFRQDCIIGDGIPRLVMVVNRQLPGPSIEVCKGDKIMVHMTNHLVDGQSTTMHFHGLHMHGKDAYFDGVPYVTQCPVNYNNNFTYKFTARDPGTHWYHSHVKVQIGDGIYGPLIVRTQETNYERQLYDRDLSDHILVVGDWSDRSWLDMFMAEYYHGDLMEPSSILVNGRSYQFKNNITNTPLANFIIEKNIRYRFRFINVGFLDCPMEFSIDGHNITIIASDGQDVKPVTVDSFVSSTGERFDFVVNANQPVRTYWIIVKGYLTCARSDVFTVATLQYNGSLNSLPAEPLPTYETAAPTGGVLLNPVSAKTSTDSGLYTNVISIAELRAITSVPQGFQEKPNYQYYITLGMAPLNNPAYNKYPYYGFYQVSPDLRVLTPQLNHISYQSLDKPVLPNRYHISSDQFCNEFTVQRNDCKNNLCQCVHLIEVSLHSVVEFVFIEEWTPGDPTVLHPIHLHGHSFRVLSWGELGRNFTKNVIISMDRNSSLPRNYNHPPLKDTVTVPHGGYTIVRVTTDNPGYWFMHCHIDLHAGDGMSLILKVGNNSEMSDVPLNFPKCGNWLF